MGQIELFSLTKGIDKPNKKLFQFEKIIGGKGQH